MSNPFLEPLGPYVSQQEWPQKLAHNPLSNVNTEGLTEERRDLILSSIRDLIEPTRYMITAASAMQRMLRRGYERRDPTSGAARREAMKIFGFRGMGTLKHIPFGPIYADALMIRGCTGFGKSTLIQRFCSLQNQFFEHGKSEVAGWIKKIQISYLIVQMPMHRGGLLYAIIAALDEVLGTEFRTRYQAKLGWTIEKLAVEIGILLVQYSVGILIIEDLQPRNFGDSPHRGEMLDILLRLLNFGIPIVFVGNPLAFAGITHHSQDLRRLTTEEPIDMVPYEADDPDWREGLAPAMWRHNVMPVPTPFDAEVSHELFECSAAIADFACKAVTGSQRLALATSDPSQVNAGHLKMYRERSSAFAECKDFIEGFKNHDPVQLSSYVDVPWEAYASRWGWQPEEIVAVGKVGGSSTLVPYDKGEVAAFQSVHKRIRTNLSARSTREASKTAANERARSQASPEDLRSGTRQKLSKNLQTLETELNVDRQSQTAPDVKK
jgi:hypothetical protein